MSLKSNLKSAFMSAYGSSESSSAEHSNISNSLASAITDAISTCIESPSTITTSYPSHGTQKGAFIASAGKGAFRSGLYSLLMDIGGGQQFHTGFASLMTTWYASCIPKDSITAGVCTPSGTSALASAIFISHDFYPSGADAGNDYVASVWSAGIIAFLKVGVVVMPGSSPPSLLSNFV